MARTINYARLDAASIRHPKVMALLSDVCGAELTLAWVFLVLWAKETADPELPEQTGVVTEATVRCVTAPIDISASAVINALVQYGLLDELDDFHWRLHDFNEHQDISGWLRRQERAKAGAAARYGYDYALSAAQADGKQCSSNAQALPIPIPKPNKTTPLPPAAAAAFDEFYRVYPRHTEKQAARRAWAKAIKLADPKVIIAAASAYADNPRRKPEYTKHPSTWLNKGCWDDEEEDTGGIPPWERQ